MASPLKKGMLFAKSASCDLKLQAHSRGQYCMAFPLNKELALCVKFAAHD